MTSWLMQQTLLLSLILSVLLIFGNWLTRRIDSVSHYTLWLIVPISLMVNSVDLSMGLNKGPVSTFIVSAKSQANALLYLQQDTQWLLGLMWFVGVVCFVAYTFYTHVKSVNRIKKKYVNRTHNAT